MLSKNIGRESLSRKVRTKKGYDPGQDRKVKNFLVLIVLLSILLLL